MYDLESRTMFLLAVLLVVTVPSTEAPGGVPASALSDWSHHNNAGHIAWRSGNLDRAAMAFRIAIEAIRPYQAERPKLMFRSIADYAGVLAEQGRPAEAEPLARWALKTRRGQSDATREEIGRDLNALARVVTDLGRGDEAEAFLQEALTSLGRAAGPARADLLTTLESLGDLYTKKDQHVKAAIHYRRVMVVRKATDADLPRADALESEASLIIDPDRWAEADNLRAKAAAIRESSSKSIGAALTQEKLAESLRRTGRPAEAEELEAKARAVRVRAPTRSTPFE